MRKNIIVIASSTGGPKALYALFDHMPRINVSILLVQHMPAFMNEGLCSRLNQSTQMTVKLARHLEPIEPGVVYVAPSEIHMELSNNRQILLVDTPKVNFVKPSADVTMKSLKVLNRDRLVGVVLTGMGKDGAAGISHIKSLGGLTIAQNKESCSIYGMPQETYKTGDVDHVLAPEKIRSKFIDFFKF